MKPSQAHLTAAQRIYDRLGRGSVADIDAIAQALAEAERGERERAARLLDAVTSPFKRAGKDAGWTDLLDLLRAAILSTITDEAR